MLKTFKKLLKLGSNMLKKLRALDHISLKWTIPKCSIFSFTILKFVAVAAPNATYAPTSKKYVTVYCLSDALKLRFWILGALYHIYS